MIKQKAPKDMTGAELIAPIKSLLLSYVDAGVYHLADMENIGEAIEERINEPAPNPFTENQIAVMLEYQKDGYKYAAKSSSGVVCVFKDKPCRVLLHANPVTRETFGSWVTRESPFEVTSFEFLKKVTNWSDPEPLCFADYAPLEDK